MPYGLFDYIPDSNIHTMGLSPVYQPAQQFRDNVTGQIIDRSVLESKATFYGGNMTPAQQEAKAKELAQEISTRYSPVQPTPVSSVRTGGGGGGGGGAGQYPSGRGGGAISQVSPPRATYTRAMNEEGSGGNPYTLRMPEDPTQMVTTAALYEEGNLPPQQTPNPPGGGGSCPPGYSPSPSVEPVRPAPAPVPNPNPIDPRITLPARGQAEEGVIPEPKTMAAQCWEDPQFCPTQGIPSQIFQSGGGGSTGSSNFIMPGGGLTYALPSTSPYRR